MPLEWFRDADDDDSTIYQAESVIHDEGMHFHWTVSREPGGMWGIDETDPELLPEEDAGREFDTLAEAQAHCERREAELVVAAREEMR